MQLETNINRMRRCERRGEGLITENLEEKIDSLIEESEKAKLERKRDRVLSKMDGLYYVLITLSTFVIGILASQRDVFISEGIASFLLLWSMVMIVFSLLNSFIVGFKGMVNDSMENRILAWCLLLVSSGFIVNNLILYCVVLLLGQNPVWVIDALVLLIGISSGFSLFPVMKRFTKWIERNLASLTGQKVDEWGKIRDRILGSIVLIQVSSAATSIVILIIAFYI
jgi:hypothetical protein